MSLIKLNNNAVKNIDSVGSVSTGDMVFIKKLTASSSATLSFVDGSDGVVLDDTYKEYVFTFKNIHPSVNSAHFSFNGSIDGGSSYNDVNHVSSVHRAFHRENGEGGVLQYHADDGGTAQFGLHNENRFQIISSYVGSDNDQNTSGILQLFNPSSTTFVKHYIAEFSDSNPNDYIQHNKTAGYINSTSAINSIRFQFTNGTGSGNGNIDAGDICLYGIA